MAIGLAMPKAFLSSLICPVYATRVLGANWVGWFAGTYLRGGLVVIPFALTMLLFHNYLILNTWLAMISLLVVSSTVHLLIVWLCGVNQLERKEISNKFATLRKRVRGLS